MTKSHPTDAIDRRPIVLVIGATGKTGRLIVDELLADPGDVRLRVAARKEEDLERFRGRGIEAVRLDLDNPLSFGTALAGVDRLYLLTAYTVDMLVQSKAMVDASRKAGVSHIVHQGVFANWDVTDPHFAWHQLVETYIEASGIAWTNLHPNFYMEYFHTSPPTGGVITSFWGDRRLGWIAARDIARVAATVLREGPARHAGKDYWLSTEALSAAEAATILGEVLGREVRAEIRQPDEITDLSQVMSEPGKPMEAKYAEGAIEFLRQIVDGRMGYIGTVRDDVPFVTGRPATTLREWFEENREALLAAVEPEN